MADREDDHDLLRDMAEMALEVESATGEAPEPADVAEMLRDAAKRLHELRLEVAELEEPAEDVERTEDALALLDAIEAHGWTIAALESHFWRCRVISAQQSLGDAIAALAIAAEEESAA